MTRLPTVLALACLALIASLHTARAEQVTFTSASPYQLGDLLQEAEPAYELEVGGDLVYPETRAERMPAFVFLHGSSGPLARHDQYLEMARRVGYATLQLNSFAPRGISSTVGNQANATAAMMATDLLRALVFLAARPEIDADRVVVMGSSKGAIAALYANWEPIRRKVAGGLDFAGYALLYPLCAAIEDGKVSPNPLHVFIGAEDNWTPPAPCKAQVDRMKGLGHDWTITLYDGAYHGFDSGYGGVRDLPSAYSFVDCRVAMRADGYEYETGSGLMLTKAERRRAIGSCARKGGVKLGGPTAAADKLLRDIEAFLRARLG